MSTQLTKTDPKVQITHNDDNNARVNGDLKEPTVSILVHSSYLWLTIVRQHIHQTVEPL